MGETMKKLTTYTAVIASVIYLAGCGGGGSNSSQPAADAKTVIKVGNQSAFDFASVSIQNQNGATLYDSQFKCVSQDTNCYINLNQDYNESVTLLFKDASGKLVRAVVVANSPNTYISLYPDATSTGFYLVNRLNKDVVANNGISWEQLNLRIATFFTNYDSPDGTVDNFEEVGLYYSSQLAKGVASEDVFLTAFKQRLLNWDVAQNNELPVAKADLASLYQRFTAFLKSDENPLIPPAYAQETTCGSGLQGFLTITENLASIIPIVGDGIAGVAGIGSSYCDGTDAKLDQIMNQLNQLQDSVNAVDRNLSQLTRFLTDQAANQKTVDFQKLADEAKNLNAQYKRFMLDNNVKTLEEFFVKKGGWEQAISSGGTALQAILRAPYKDSAAGGIYTKTLNTTQYADFNTYLEALKNRCGTLPTSSDENFIVTRQQCNNIILSNSGMLVAAQGLTLPIYKDVYATLNAYKEQAKNSYLLPNGLTSFATAYAEVKESFAKQQSDMVRDYKAKIGTTGYFNAFEGLNSSLISSLVNRECMQSGRDRGDGPAIVGWFAPSTIGKENYIETVCKVGSNSQRIKARYYYNDQGSVVNANDVANVLGVPVAYDYVKNDWPLYNSNANIGSERFTYLSQIHIEAEGMFSYGEGTNSIINQGSVEMKKIYSSPATYDYPLSAVRNSIYVTFPSKDQSAGKIYYHVAKFSFREQRHSVPLVEVYSYLACVAAPCRVDPNTDQWLIFADDNETLDLWKLSNGNFRLGPVGSK
jgi:hypothetical protein